MENEAQLVFPSPVYLLKVLSGLAILAMVGLTAFWLPVSGATELQQQFVLSILMILAIGMIPLVKLIYRRMDELQKLLHKNASMISLSIVSSVSCLIGILQASNIIPLFNQFWTLGVVVVVWGINLMLADHRFK